MRAGTLKEDYLIKYLQRTTGQLRVEKVTAITFSKNARNGFGCDRNLPPAQQSHAKAFPVKPSPMPPSYLNLPRSNKSQSIKNQAIVRILRLTIPA